MHFTETGVGEFHEIFDTHKMAIRNFEGCTHLELLKDADHHLIYTTLSHWKDPESLERYRNSPLFSAVWGRVRRLFAERTQAFSLVRFMEL